MLSPVLQFQIMGTLLTLTRFRTSFDGLFQLACLSPLAIAFIQWLSACFRHGYF